MFGLYSGTGRGKPLRTRQSKLFIPEVPEMKQSVRNRWSIRTHRRDSMNPRSFNRRGSAVVLFLEPDQELGFAHFQPGTNAPCPIHSRFLRMGGRPQNLNRPPELGILTDSQNRASPSYIASGLSIPSLLSTSISSRSATAAVASKKVFRAGSSSVRMWCLW